MSNDDKAPTCVTCGNSLNSSPTESYQAEIFPQDPLTAFNEAPNVQVSGSASNVAAYMPVRKEKKDLTTAGFICSLVGLFTALLPVIGLAAGLTGLILSVISLRRKRSGLAIAGVAISCVALVIGIAGLIGMMMFANSFSAQDSLTYAGGL